MKKQNKKGFTLAELLIVVAIIAVLTAIAIPLFVGALNKAEESVKAANIRAVRSVACYEILENQDTYFVVTYKTIKKEDGSTVTAAEGNNYAWYATATVTADGEVQDFKIQATAATDPSLGDKNGIAVKSGSSYKVQVKLTETNLTEAA